MSIPTQKDNAFDLVVDEEVEESVPFRAVVPEPSYSKARQSQALHDLSDFL